MLLTAITLIFRNRIVARFAPSVSALSPERIALLTVVVGGVLGVLVSISSVGAGAIGVTALVLLYPKLPTARIVGSDIVHAVPLTLVGGIGHWLLGSIDWQVFTALIFGSVPGILIGSYAAARFNETALRVVLAVTLLAVATKLSFGLLPLSSDVVAAQTTQASLSTKPRPTSRSRQDQDVIKAARLTLRKTVAVQIAAVDVEPGLGPFMIREQPTNQAPEPARNDSSRPNARLRALPDSSSTKPGARMSRHEYDSTPVVEQEPQRLA